MKKILKWTVIGLGTVFILIQVIRPDRTNPPVNPANDYTQSMTVPADVKSIIDRACRDCHTNETRWPWYSNIAPVSWLLADDVHEGRRHMNLSEWGTYKLSRKISRLSNIDTQLSDGSMPLPNYVRMHPEAVLTQADRDKLSHWANEEGRKLGGDDD